MGSKPVKVVIIDTQYVETDAVSFKSVVQRLTGKDTMKLVIAHNEDGEAKQMLSKGISFEGFDRMVNELPPLDELYDSLLW